MDFLSNIQPGGWAILGIFFLMLVGVVVSFLKKKKKDK
jgi:LPXTG-motif cell wall-anchored protein